METCLRGFSFMPENKVEVMDLQYIEGGELSRAWKTSRRQRLKELETKIWEEFVKEQDIVSSVCSDDPYQFLEKLPDDCLKELMEVELKKMRKENVEEVPEEIDTQEQPEQQEIVETPDPRPATVTFADDSEPEACEMIHIFDDDKDEDLSSPEQEVINDSIDSPCTVRAQDSPGPELRESPVQVSEKSTENVRNMIETNIYSAKVKELQFKVNLELLAIITTLEAQDLNKIEPQDLPKLRRQCSEFCARFNRIYMYQLKRQINDITRHNNSALPFARHTFLRTQMTRAVSLQQNMLQALQIFHKWFGQKTPLRECVESLKSFTQLVREGDIVCPIELHNEELLQTCQHLDLIGNEYLQRVTNYWNVDNTSTTRPKKSSVRGVAKKRPIGLWQKPGLKSNAETDARLSMYSLDTLRVNSKPSSTRDSGCTSKARLGEAETSNKPEDVTQKKKTPRSRRPLMRAPGMRAAGGAKREKPREDSIPTMVEAVEMGTPSHASREDTPRESPRAPAPPTKLATPHGIRKSKDSAPQRTRSPTRTQPSPKLNVTPQELKLALNSVKVASETSLSPAIQSEDKRSPKSGHDIPRPLCQSPDAVGLSMEKSPSVVKEKKEDRKSEKDVEVSSCEVSRLLRRLCAGATASAGAKNERVSGARNAQLLCVNGGSPRQPSTPQLLRILEETIQKKIPKPQYPPTPKVKDVDRYRLNFNVTTKAAEALFQYRTKFVQHMLSSPMYANSAVGKPWEVIGSVSEQIIDDMLLACAKELQLEDFVKELYKSETQ